MIYFFHLYFDFTYNYFNFVPALSFREMTSLVLPNEWPCSWLKCRAWCVEAVETSVHSSSAPRTSLRPLMRLHGWQRKWPSSALTRESGQTCSRSVCLCQVAKEQLRCRPLLTFFSCCRCVNAFPPSAHSLKSCPRSKPLCWVVPTSAKRSQSRCALKQSLVFSYNDVLYFTMELLITQIKNKTLRSQLLITWRSFVFWS